MRWVDLLLGPLDEWIVSHLITDWREEVWKNAVHLIEYVDDAERAALRQRVEQHSLARAHSILGEDGLVGLIELVE